MKVDRLEVVIRVLRGKRKAAYRTIQPSGYVGAWHSIRVQDAELAQKTGFLFGDPATVEILATAAK